MICVATAPLDTTTRYTVAGFAGIAFYFAGYAKTWTEGEWVFLGDDNDDPDDEANYVYDEPEQVEDRSRARMVMVGDDHVFEIDVDDLTQISEDDYCHECGQIGCRGDLRERTS